MQAIILAAGYGRRMRPLTYTTHKTMLPIADRSVIQWIIDALIANQITDIAIVTGYLATELQNFVTDLYPHLNFTFIHNERYEETNNIFSMSLALGHLTITTDILLIECDLIFEPAVITRLLQSPHPNVALVDNYRLGLDGTVVDVHNGIITDIITPARQDDDFYFDDKYKTLNIYRFSADFCNGIFRKILTYYAQVINNNAYYELILGLLIYLQHETIHAVILDDEQWAEIDDPNDLQFATFQFDPTTRQEILNNSHGGYWHYDILDFCYIRNMYFPTDALLSQMRHSLPELLYNYGSKQTILNQKLAYYLFCDAQKLTTLNGLAQIFPILSDYFNNATALIPTPTFGEYNRLFPQADTYPDNFTFDLDAIAAQAPDYDLIIFVNPNNPTGTTISTNWLYQFAQTHPATTIIVDESFIDFAPERSLLPLLEHQPLDNIIIMQSLSKSLGVPGLRLGYVYTSNSDINHYIRRHVPIWNMNSMAEHFIELLLKNRSDIRHSLRQTILDRQEFAENLSQLPLVQTVHPSGGNFLLLTLNCSPTLGDQIATKLLLDHQIYIKTLSDRFDSPHATIRLAVRLPQENQHLINCLHQTHQTILGEQNDHQQQMAHNLAE
ncbi:MAG TPA: aminotransferase class I/II-fold pyridoxal phosphate-dependent enzyme [Anaerolineae bacterium]|nr:aminotransferase class I/II-fold pyridoxal phosphate-dependent enzyme [Anaerolineae bacterium]